MQPFMAPAAHTGNGAAHVGGVPAPSAQGRPSDLFDRVSASAVAGHLGPQEAAGKGADGAAQPAAEATRSPQALSHVIPMAALGLQGSRDGGGASESATGPGGETPTPVEASGTPSGSVRRAVALHTTLGDMGWDAAALGAKPKSTQIVPVATRDEVTRLIPGPVRMRVEGELPALAAAAKGVAAPLRKQMPWWLSPDRSLSQVLDSSGGQPKPLARGASLTASGGSEGEGVEGARALPPIADGAARPGSGSPEGGLLWRPQAALMDEPASQPPHLRTPGAVAANPGAPGSANAASGPHTVAAEAPAPAEAGLPAPKASAVRAQAAYWLGRAVRIGRREATITLDPPELGRLRIHLRTEGQIVTARITAELPEVEALLREGVPEIRERLARAGLRVERLVVEAAAPNRAAQRAAGAPLASDSGTEEPAQGTQDEARGGSLFHGERGGARNAADPRRHHRRSHTTAGRSIETTAPTGRQRGGREAPGRMRVDVRV